MRRKKLFTVIMVALVVFGLTAVLVSPALAEKKQVTRKMLLGGRLGDPWFVLSQALAYFVNKQSDWLRIEVVASPGASAGAEIASKDYEKYLFISPYYGMKLNPTMKRINYYDKERIIGFCTIATHVWITYDKNIKTAQDLVGKKVFIGRPGGARSYFEKKTLEEQGVLDKVKLLHGGFGGGRNALRDGLADATLTAIDYILPAGFKKGAFIEDLETRKPIYYPNITPKELQQKLGMIPLGVYPGALDKKTQKETFYAACDPIYFCTDARMDDALVREVTRILYANADKFSGWHAQGAGINKETVATYVIGPQQMHPAAKKYYEEQGAKIKPVAEFLP